ncbi:MAG: prolipoprotein diacylglyceryl transferase [Candidatus Woesearchaeota archaeon]
MYVHQLNPVLLTLGFLEIRYYGLVYLFGFVLCYLYIFKDRKNLKLSLKQVDDLTFWMVIGLFIGARLFHFIFNEPLTLIREPWQLVMAWLGGMSFFGGLIGVFAGAALYIRLTKIQLDIIQIADLLVIPVTFALMLGRLANFLNSELLGLPSASPWCVIFPLMDLICRHPYQLYAAFSHLILLCVLIAVGKHPKKGRMLATFLIMYGFLRVITDFFRDDWRIGSLTIWQYASIGIIFVGVWVWKQHGKS